ncbi:MAG: cobyrinate a,c-diamide synthase [Alphaproteobacteria bacterium]|nr:cobyrinate a,c-diamide synthase [Alphaproteobacteria bacterium]
MSAPALILAAPASASGKTTLTLALLRAYRKRGVRVASFKVGPDYIDPAFHAAASGLPCLNIDSWAMRPGTVAGIVSELGNDAELIVGEGVMGLFDGAAGGGGSTADVAAALGLPVVLVQDVRGQWASAAAVIEGFANYRDDVTVAGAIFNRVASPRHAALLQDACAGVAPVRLGAVPRDACLSLPDRHLGLVQAGEHEALDDFLDVAAELVAAHVDLDALAALARAPTVAAETCPPPPPLGQRIAIAEDTAFAFAYRHLCLTLQKQGVELLPFSPLADEAPPPAADAVYLPGGYPELHAGRLAANSNFLDGLRAAAAGGATVYGECGGYMVLGEGLVDGDGARHAMAGLLPLETAFAAPRLHLGYRQLVLAAATPLGPKGARFRGHEFHYAEGTPGKAEALFQASDSAGQVLGPVGLRVGPVMGSFMHLVDAA